MEKLDLNKFQIRTDLAFEAIDMHKTKIKQKLTPGEDEYQYQNLTIKKTIIDEALSREIGKKVGLYYSIDSSAIKSHDHDELAKLEDALTFTIKDVLNVEGITNKHKGLVVGLGNMNVTPDSLGPIVIDNVIVTRHMFLLDPEGVSEGISDISAIAPGVMGTTGIETFDIIDAIANKIKIDYIIVVDALASKSIARVNKTIQVTNTGISPGSGVGNRRKELSKETMKCPVIAIGVPTVVDAVTIASDTIDFLLKHFHQKMSEDEKVNNKKKAINYEEASLPNEKYTKHFLGEFGVLDEEEKRSLIAEVLTPNGYNMMVTPKEVDLDIEDLSQVISGAIDRALHTIVNHS